MSGGMYTTSSAGYSASNSTYGRSVYSGSVNTHANNRCEQPTYRIGQNRIITSTFQQPRMARINDLTSLSLGGGNTYTEQDAFVPTKRRVGGGDHPSDPMLTPVGDVPWLLLAGMAFAYFLYRKISLHKPTKKRP